MDRSETVAKLASHLQRRGWWLSCAESCTGGGIAAALTDVAGSSAWFDRGFVTYSNQAKRDMLGVADATLAAYGAVSRETVTEMASGALARSAGQAGWHGMDRLGIGGACRGGLRTLFR